MIMTSGRTVGILVTLTMLVLLTWSASARTVGQVIDDTTIVTKIKAKLVADKPSNLTHVSVKAMEGVVTLNGEVDSVAVRDRAIQIASSVDGVRTVVDNIRLSGQASAPPVGSAPPPPAASPATVVAPASDVEGVVAAVDAQAGTITLQDGRVIRLGEGTVIWQPVAVGALQPGTRIAVRNGLPVAVR